jgi:hypothetical protein
MAIEDVSTVELIQLYGKRIEILGPNGEHFALDDVIDDILIKRLQENSINEEEDVQP